MKGCVRLFGLFLLAVLFISIAGFTIRSFASRNDPPTPTPLPTEPITHYCIHDTDARSRLALYMAQAINSDDIGVLKSVTDRPADHIAVKYGTDTQVQIIQFSALKRGTGKYKKGHLYVYLRDRDCSIIGHNLLW
ncbi:MAG: hypothetical protein OXO48_18450 [Caldilineaceae bacterium]|nr:hypothetical protein [Caldilineaceae bacterium]